jgi:hypothetical protein
VTSTLSTTIRPRCRSIVPRSEITPPTSTWAPQGRSPQPGRRPGCCATSIPRRPCHLRRRCSDRDLPWGALPWGDLDVVAAAVKEAQLSPDAQISWWSSKKNPCAPQRVPGLEREHRVGLEGNSPGLATRNRQARLDALALARLAILENRFTQQLHPGPCNFPGSCNPSVMRSNFAPAPRASADMVRQPGAVRRTRGARAPHSGQADGSSHSAIARSCVNGPHFLHIYSYVGINHLPPAEPHPAADQSVTIVGKHTS